MENIMKDTQVAVRDKPDKTPLVNWEDRIRMNGLKRKWKKLESDLKTIERGEQQ